MESEFEIFRDAICKFLGRCNEQDAHYYEVMGHHTDPNSLSRLLGFTIEELQILFFKAGFIITKKKKGIMQQ